MLRFLLAYVQGTKVPTALTGVGLHAYSYLGGLPWALSVSEAGPSVSICGPCAAMARQGPFSLLWQQQLFRCTARRYRSQTAARAQVAVPRGVHGLPADAAAALHAFPAGADGLYMIVDERGVVPRGQLRRRPSPR